MTSEPEIDFLSEEAPEEVLPEETPAAPEPAAETVVTPEAPAPVVTTTPEPQEDRVPLAALRAEREKRQQYERELHAYRQREQAQAEPLPSFYEAPEQFVQQHIQGVEHQMTQRMYAAMEDMARDAHPDYDEVFAEVEAAAQGNPALLQQIFGAPNPASAAYRMGKQLREMKQMQDPAAYRQKIEAEVRAQIEAEGRATQAARDAIPPDLSAVRASKDTEVLPDDSLDSILKSKR